jgi:hypothetical protein
MAILAAERHPCAAQGIGYGGERGAGGKNSQIARDGLGAGCYRAGHKFIFQFPAISCCITPPHNAACLGQQRKASSSFLKKRTKKLLS